MRFHFLGGRFLTPARISHVQTDGSFKKGVGRVAVLLHHDSNIFRDVRTIPNLRDSYEAEWASVYHGILFSFQHDAYSLHLENDNLGVIQNLLQTPRVSKPRVLSHRTAILDLASKGNWIGIRWIPRAKNRADDLFHSKSKRSV